MAKKQISASVDGNVAYDIEAFAGKNKRSFSLMVEIALEAYRDNIPEAQLAEAKAWYAKSLKGKAKKKKA